MMQNLFVNNNGKIIEANQYTVETSNRAYLYGDGLFETIRIINGKPVNLNIHLTRLFEGMTVLKMRIPSYFNETFFHEKIIDLLQKSNLAAGGKIRLSIDRLRGGTYRPQTNEVSYFIEVYPVENNAFELNNKGWEIDIFSKIYKEKNLLSNFKTKNGLLNVLAAIDAEERRLDDVLLTNAKGNIIESTGSNLFVVSNGVLYTPGLDEGCLGGTMRMTIINIALENKLKVYESVITPQNLLMADEIFLTNAINGIIWVGGFRTKRYMKTTAQKLIKFLNEHFTATHS